MKIKTFLSLLFLFMLQTFALQSCKSYDDDISHLESPSVSDGEDGGIDIVTLVPVTGNRILIIDSRDSCYLASNILVTDLDIDKETRAMASLQPLGFEYFSGIGPLIRAKVRWVETIPTFNAEVASDTIDHPTLSYGNTPVEIVRSWALTCTDGYLTLPVRSSWGNNFLKHSLKLISRRDPSTPLDFYLCHDNKGYPEEQQVESIIAFNLNDIVNRDTLKSHGDGKIRLHWMSFSGEKTALFDFSLRSEKIIE